MIKRTLKWFKWPINNGLLKLKQYTINMNLLHFPNQKSEYLLEKTIQKKKLKKKKIFLRKQNKGRK